MTDNNLTPDTVVADTQNTEHDVKEWQAEPDAEEKTAAEPDTDTEANEGDKPDEHKSRAQKRIEQLARENAEYRRKMAELEAKTAVTGTELVRPNIIDFEDYAAYEEALEEYTLAKAEQRILQKQQEREAQSKQVEKSSEWQVAVDELDAQGVNVADYVQKAESLPPLPVTLDQFGLSPKDTFLLAKDLIDDVDTYYEIAGMTPVQAAMRIGQLIGQKSAKPVQPPVSKAPPPIKPVKANAPASRDPSAMSDDEWYREQTKKRQNRG